METFPTTETKPAAPTGDAKSGDEVDIKDFKFVPDMIKVKKGTKLTFTNSDSAGHTATADDDSFDTEALDQGDKKTVTITKAGEIPYICDFHPYMKGTVVVE
ncbi:MAG: cupredoxin domain-containing protein [Thermoleophilaceae bacterium]|nr:cupredoxin domain-containing protein [Thermoleophilaceae bacterium]